MEALLQQGWIGGVGVSGGARVVPAAATPVSRLSSVHLKPNVGVAPGCVRFSESLGGGNRAGVLRYLQSAPDGVSSQNAESDAREQFLDQAKAESALTIDQDEEPFRDAVESGQTIGEATTELQFGANDGKSADQAIAHTSKELFEQKSHGKPEPPKEDPEHEKEEVSSDVWASKDEGGSTHAFLDDSKKIDFHGEDDESILGIGGQGASDGQM